METNNSAVRFEHSIRRFIENPMLELLLKGKDRNEEIQKSENLLNNIDARNEHFKELMSDTMENLRMVMYLIITVLCIVIDFFLVFNGLTLLLNNNSILSLILKIGLPIFFVVGEIAISYFSIVKQNNGEHVSWTNRNLQYFVIALLVAFSTSAIIHSLGGYNAQIDGGSRLGFVAGSFIAQLVLLLPAVMIHLWLIRNAEEVVYTLAYYKYRITRNTPNSKIANLLSRQKADQTLFIKLCHSLLKQIESFRLKYPRSSVRFENTMPVVLIRAINVAMGRVIFSEDSSSDSLGLNSSIYEP